MTIDEAIEILFSVFGGLYEGSDLDKDRALKLGIEALKRCRVIKQESVLKPFTLLPGETEE